jgi:hypothetical protein
MVSGFTVLDCHGSNSLLIALETEFYAAEKRDN